MAVGANAFEDEVCRGKGETWGKDYFRNRHFVKTEGALTLLAIEMHVEVGKGMRMCGAATTVFLTKGELCLPTTVLYLMYQMMF